MRVTLPASRTAVVLTLLVGLLIMEAGSAVSQVPASGVSPSGLTADEVAVRAAVDWLRSHQQPDGSYGAYLEAQAAAAALALHLNDSNSLATVLSYSWLAAQLDDPSAWFWSSFGEADVPGEVLYSLAVGNYLGLSGNPQGIVSRTLAFQQPTGGFKGFYDAVLGQNVASSVDTAFALLGLAAAGSALGTSRMSATRYLLSLQSRGGSFNLTSSISHDPIYSLGPDPISITAVVVLALREECYTARDPPIAAALGFLSDAVAQDFNGHVFSAAVSALVFTSFNRPEEASRANEFILSRQNVDGGFSDTSRFSYPSSNVLDTGWAAIALQAGKPLRAPACPPLAKFSLDPQIPQVGMSIQFDARDSYDPNDDALSFRWTFGDGATSMGVETTHAYDRSGDFTVTLTVTETDRSHPALSNTTWVKVTVSPREGSAGLPPGPILMIWALVGVGVAGAAISSAVYLLRRRQSPMP